MQREIERQREDTNYLISGANSASIHSDVKTTQKLACLLLI